VSRHVRCDGLRPFKLTPCSVCLSQNRNNCCAYSAVSHTM
jgi:hypothetical protein